MDDFSGEGCRVLIVDDNRSFHDELREAFRLRMTKLAGGQAESARVVDQEEGSDRCRFEIVSAYHGQEACRAIRDATGTGRRFDLAFVAVRMPTGWDRVDTIKQLWSIDPALHVVISGRLSDAGWRSIAERLGHDANAILLRHPLDQRAVLQLVTTLNQKCRRLHEANLKQSTLERIVEHVNDERSNDCEARQMQPIDGEPSWATDQVNLRQELHQELRVAISALTHASELARRVVSVASFEAVKRDRTVVGEIIDELVRSIQRLSGDRVVSKVGVSAASAAIWADRCQIHRALAHLCYRAANAMPLGDCITIDANIVDATVHRSLRLKPGRGRPVPRHVAIGISDSGSSIPITVRDRMFEPVLAEPYCSTVHGIVERHCGWIKIESCFAVGTKVVINLPLVDDPRDVAIEPQNYEKRDQKSRCHPAVSL